MTWEWRLFDDYAMTGLRENVDFGEAHGQQSILIENTSNHPLAAGLSGTVKVLTEAGDFHWGKVPASAEKIAVLPGHEDRAVVFGFERGAALVGMTAPARRVGLFMPDDGAAHFTQQGWAIFDAAVRWAVGVSEAKN
jgi:hypothetical protein